MNKEQFNKLKESLINRGYRIFDQHWHHEDYVIGKGFHKKDNKFDDERNALYIGLSIYDYADKPYPLHNDIRNHVGIDVHFDVSRTSGERVDFSLIWHDNTTIEEIEKLAESFYSWVVCMMPKPRKEE